MDTDSIFYVHKEYLWIPPTGNYLGDMTDELDGDTVSVFVSDGPKNYMYKQANSGAITCKIKGFSLNYRTSKQINFETMVDLVTTVPREKIKIYPHRLRRTKDMRIIARDEEKDYRIVYDKRQIRHKYFTIPYGYTVG
jgi:hypothetical protein